jgi:cytochrome P450 hydroxylase
VNGLVSPVAAGTRGALRILGGLFGTGRPDPYPLYRRLHELGSSFRSPLGTVYVVGFQACHDVLRRPALLVEDRPLRDRARTGTSPEAQRSPFYDSLLFLNGDAHRRVRSAVQPAFTPRALSRLADDLQARSAALCARLAARRSPTFDVYADYAWPLQLGTLAALLGVPRERVGIVRDLMPDVILLGTPEMWASRDAAERARVASARLVGFLGELLAGGAAAMPGGLLRLLANRVDEGALSGHDAMATLSAVVVAGVETTVGVVANAVSAVLATAGAAGRLTAGPDDDRAVTELIRMATPIHVVDRWVRGEAEVDGRVLPDGAHVVLLLGAANRDPARFTDPDVLDLDRPGTNLAFGGGSHYCLGAPLARLHVRIAVPALFAAFPGLTADGAPTAGPYLNPHAFWHVPVRRTA